ncbi:granulin b isoform X1 [Nerophis ophidion]|uniref:granulin b isoform X1 n=2 Tax=Nerophis ophidion TaxID=159077 RepID=UPI002AE08C07|nr:granulin b isoform X1 [Nerophis ophidion]
MVVIAAFDIKTCILGLTLLTLGGALVCPDGGVCEDQSTCCKNAMGGYGCCPLPRAVCCSDGLHCCFEGSVCDVLHDRCVNKTASLPWASPLPVQQLSQRAAAIMCPDQQSECPDATTCCQLPDSSWGCCPLAKAVCCEDKRHCCPEGSTCDISKSRCVSPSGSWRPLLAKLPAKTKDEHLVSVVPPTCPGGGSGCPDTFTCCLLVGGDYGCCPHTQAGCCHHVHCCPGNSTCDLQRGMCQSADAQVALLKRRPASAVVALAEKSECDESTWCPGVSTCCRSVSGGWACCPLKQAVCCADQKHCCPHAKVCNLQAQTCDDPSGVAPPLPWLTQVEPAQLRLPGLRKTCDERTSCPKDTSCCFMKRTRTWGCCPLPQAVCCEDGEHCCPAGHVCEPHRASCSRGRRAVPWLAKVAASTAADVKCDNKSSCAAGSTCCKLPDGEWGCCPLVKAVCCADREHCCPQGYTCNMETGTCEKTAPAVLPCDATAAFGCPEQETCCRSSASQWACCPSPGATCCADLRRCCPAGFFCDLKTGGCSPAPPTWDTGAEL